MPTVITGPEGYLRILMGWRLYYVMMNIHVYDLGVAKGFGSDMEAKFIKRNEVNNGHFGKTHFVRSSLHDGMKQKIEMGLSATRVKAM